MARMWGSRNENGRAGPRESDCGHPPLIFCLDQISAMNFKTRTLEELRTRRASAAGKFAVAGFDGFVDRIVHPVATPFGAIRAVPLLHFYRVTGWLEMLGFVPHPKLRPYLAFGP